MAVYDDFGNVIQPGRAPNTYDDQGRTVADRAAQNKSKIASSKLVDSRSFLQDFGQGAGDFLRQVTLHPLSLLPDMSHLKAPPGPVNPKEELLGALSTYPLGAPLAEYLRGNDTGAGRATGQIGAGTAIAAIAATGAAGVGALKSPSEMMSGVSRAQRLMPVYYDDTVPVSGVGLKNYAIKQINKLPGVELPKVGETKTVRRFRGYMDPLEPAAYGDATRQPAMADPTAALVDVRNPLVTIGASDEPLATPVPHNTITPGSLVPPPPTTNPWQVTGSPVPAPEPSLPSPPVNTPNTVHLAQAGSALPPTWNGPEPPQGWEYAKAEIGGAKKAPNLTKQPKPSTPNPVPVSQVRPRDMTSLEPQVGNPLGPGLQKLANKFPQAADALYAAATPTISSINEPIGPTSAPGAAMDNLMAQMHQMLLAKGISPK